MPRCFLYGGPHEAGHVRVLPAVHIVGHLVYHADDVSEPHSFQKKDDSFFMTVPVVGRPIPVIFIVCLVLAFRVWLGIDQAIFQHCLEYRPRLLTVFPAAYRAMDVRSDD